MTEVQTFGATKYSTIELGELICIWLGAPDLQEITSWAESLREPRRTLLLLLANRLNATQFYDDGGKPAADHYPPSREPALGKITAQLLTLDLETQSQGEQRARAWVAHFTEFSDFANEVYGAQRDAMDLGALRLEDVKLDPQLIATFTTYNLVGPDDFVQCGVAGCMVRSRPGTLVDGICAPELRDERHDAYAVSVTR